MPALIPVAVAALSVLLAAALNFSERSFFGTALEDQFYGYFFRSYPLFLFAIAYGAARIVVAAVAVPGSRRALRAFSAPLGLGLFLTACIYPSFGGFILRPGFATGGIGFIEGFDANVAVMLGAGAAALMFALALGLCTAIATLRIRLGWGALAEAVLSCLALWAGAVILLIPQRVGFELLAGFPLRPLGFSQVPAIAALVALAFLPHAAATSRTGAASRQAGSSAA